MTRPILTLLLVENFAPDRELYRRYLLSDTGSTYQVIEAETAIAGLELCQTQSIDGILLNCALPDQDGLAFLQALKTQALGRVPPVVMVAGQGNAQQAVQAIKLGAEDYLLKHQLTPTLLQSTMRSAIENARLRLQLQQSHDRFRVSVENMLDCFGFFSAIRDHTGQITDFRIEYFNAAALEANRMTADAIGKGLCELLPAHRETGLFADYCQLVETGEPLIRENLIYSDVYDQRFLTRAFDIRASKLDDGFVASWRDVTGVKRTEAELQASEQRFRELFNTTYQFVGLLTPEGILLEANQTALEFAGLTREDVIGRPFWEMRWWTLSPHTQQRLQDAIRRASQGEFVRYEVEVLGAGETTAIIDFSLKPMRDESGRVVQLIPEGRDISDRIRREFERQQNEQRLRDSETQLKVGVEVAGVALARFDYASNTVELSPEAATLYGLPAEQRTVSRERIHATFHPEEREMMEHIIAQVLDPSGAGWFEREHRVVWQTGEVRWLTARKQVFFEEIGGSLRPSYAILAAIDITDRKRAEAERNQLLAAAEKARQDAEAANQSKDEFVALVAHELRSPLNSILGWSKLLQSRQFDAGTTAKALETIERNTRAQVQLVEDLLDLSRVISGKLYLNEAPVQLSTVIEAAIDLVQPQAQAKQIQLNTELRITPQILGDFNRLQQIVVNLLTNAIKFTPERGRVEIELAQIETQVALRVTDTGKGIAPELLPLIFERYQQGQKNTGSKDGLGLGLAIVKNLVELHQGAVSAASPGVGQGATFTVRFPMLSLPAIAQQPVPPSTIGTSLAGIRVLVVDDEPDMLELITFVLEEYGAEVTSATNAATALSLVQEVKPDLLLSDIAMPGGTGYDLIQEIRRLEVGQSSMTLAEQLPAIALTAYASATYEERSLQAGFQRHLSKPVEPEVLVAAILDLVRLRR